MMIIKSVMFSFLFGNVIRLTGGEQRSIKSAGTVDFTEMSITYGTAKKLMYLTRSGGPITYLCRGEILHNYQRQFKALKEKK